MIHKVVMQLGSERDIPLMGPKAEVTGFFRLTVYCLFVPGGFMIIPGGDDGMIELNQ